MIKAFLKFLTAREYNRNIKRPGKVPILIFLSIRMTYIIFPATQMTDYLCIFSSFLWGIIKLMKYPKPLILCLVWSVWIFFHVSIVQQQQHVLNIFFCYLKTIFVILRLLEFSAAKILSPIALRNKWSDIESVFKDANETCFHLHLSQQWLNFNVGFILTLIKFDFARQPNAQHVWN